MKTGRKGRDAAASLAVACLLTFPASGCQSSRSFPAIDLTAPGWKVRNAQAVWRPDKMKPEIVGDLTLAQQSDGSSYLQFSKAFPIVSARLEPDGWQIEFPPREKHYSAPGQPPRRIGWLQLLRVLSGSPPALPWTIRDRTAGSVTLESSKTGESLEVHFD